MSSRSNFIRELLFKCQAGALRSQGSRLKLFLQKIEDDYFFGESAQRIRCGETLSNSLDLGYSLDPLARI